MKKIICTHCNGNGNIWYTTLSNKRDYRECDICKGKGYIEVEEKQYTGVINAIEKYFNNPNWIPVDRGELKRLQVQAKKGDLFDKFIEEVFKNGRTNNI